MSLLQLIVLTSAITMVFPVPNKVKPTANWSGNPTLSSVAFRLSARRNSRPFYLLALKITKRSSSAHGLSPAAHRSNGDRAKNSSPVGDSYAISERIAQEHYSIRNHSSISAMGVSNAITDNSSPHSTQRDAYTQYPECPLRLAIFSHSGDLVFVAHNSAFGTFLEKGPPTKEGQTNEKEEKPTWPPWTPAGLRILCTSATECRSQDAVGVYQAKLAFVRGRKEKHRNNTRNPLHTKKRWTPRRGTECGSRKLNLSFIRTSTLPSLAIYRYTQLAYHTPHTHIHQKWPLSDPVCMRLL